MEEHGFGRRHRIGRDGEAFAMIAAAQLPLFADEPLLYHELTGAAYFGALVRTNGRMLHDCYPVEQLPLWLRLVDSRRDTFISQAQFSRPQRRIAALRSIGLVWADCGDDGELGRYGDAVAVDRSLRAIDEASIPAPSLIVSTGRGYHAKWLFERGIPWQALDRWCVLERTIVERLRDPLNADHRATDAARVLRVVGTANSRTGTVARVVWSNDVGGVPLRYGFDALADEVLPQLRASHHERRGEVRLETATRRAASGAAHYTVGSLWWGRYRDLRRLCALRGWSPGYGGVPEGYRDQVLFLGSVALSWIARPGTWWGEVQSLAADLTPSLRENEWRAYAGTAYRRLMESVGNGKPERRYKYSTARIICDLGISREEMALLEVLVDPDIAHVRKRANDQKRVQEARRARGVVERGTYLATAEKRAQDVRRLAVEGLSQAAIAKHLGVNQSTVSRVLARV
jgi:hypothetical protein